MVTTRPPKTIVKPTALGPVANTDTKLLIYGLFQKGRVLAQDGDDAKKSHRDRGEHRGQCPEHMDPGHFTAIFRPFPAHHERQSDSSTTFSSPAGFGTRTNGARSLMARPPWPPDLIEEALGWNYVFRVATL